MSEPFIKEVKDTLMYALDEVLESASMFTRESIVQAVAMGDDLLTELGYEDPDYDAGIHNTTAEFIQIYLAEHEINPHGVSNSQRADLCILGVLSMLLGMRNARIVAEEYDG